MKTKVKSSSASSTSPVSPDLSRLASGETMRRDETGQARAVFTVFDNMDALAAFTKAMFYNHKVGESQIYKSVKNLHYQKMLTGICQRQRFKGVSFFLPL